MRSLLLLIFTSVGYLNNDHTRVIRMDCMLIPIIPFEPLRAVVDTANVFVIVNLSRILEDGKHLFAGPTDHLDFLRIVQ